MPYYSAPVASIIEGMATPDIRNTEKPNVISTQQFDAGTIQSGTGGWDTRAPVSDNDVQKDPYSPQMLGGGAVSSSDHNSEWLSPTNPD